jgi:hypothetical protein
MHTDPDNAEAPYPGDRIAADRDHASRPAAATSLTASSRRCPEAASERAATYVCPVPQARSPGSEPEKNAQNKYRYRHRHPGPQGNPAGIGQVRCTSPKAEQVRCTSSKAEQVRCTSPKAEQVRCTSPKVETVDAS